MMGSEEAWRTGHRAALPVMWLLALVTAVMGLAAINGVTGALTILLWAIAPVVVIIVAAFAAARTVRKAPD